ncbi:hypothetical protein [Avibacterium endocarditidis]|uniref:Uncharacterized protein n=1 Tax=Avibacterium endocarditidis TaxID=380674 RepID=A0ABX4ZU04_9PAST|nr:hypothetical protein [Avibacterium endocarditidis]POY42529.1 hypothetical protein C3Z13_04990 [Avibacterium endocarditidis]
MKSVKHILSALVVGSAVLASVPSYATDCAVTNVNLKKAHHQPITRVKSKAGNVAVMRFMPKKGKP